MATEAQLQRERKAGVRELRRTQRALDTQVERIERRLYQLLDRKTLIDRDDAVWMVNLWIKLLELLGNMERALTDFVEIVNQ